MANAVKLALKTYMMVSGASRGIGRALAVECAAKFAAGSVVVLLARSATGLDETRTQILARNPNNVTVFKFTIDLTRPSVVDLAAIFRSTLNGVDSIDDFHTAMIIHNVGTIGDITKFARDFGPDMSVMQEYYSINVFSVVALNRAFLDVFNSDARRRLIVNITSQCSSVPCKTFVLYCSGKAAREMYFRVLAKEEDDIIVLNYSPGPVDTAMTLDIRANSASPEIRDSFNGFREENVMLEPVETARKFVEIVERGDYKTGDQIDFYDS